MFRTPLCLFAVLLAFQPAASARPQGCLGNTTGNVPLIDLAGGQYNGFPGALYPGSGNVPPAAHLAEALIRAAEIVPRADGGQPEPACGKIGMLSIGMSNTAHAFAQFEREADADALRNPRIVLINGAQGGKAASLIRDPGAAYWGLVDNRLDALGVTAQQIQVIWLQELNVDPLDDFPVHAMTLRDDLEAIVQNLHAKFPNLKLCYVSDNLYGGYTTTINPEPQAYETGFATQWLINDQIQGKPELNFDPANGPVLAPLLLWGPYLWADGTDPNSKGTTWCACDFENCGNVHPSPEGELKAASLLKRFFSQNLTATPWYAPPQKGESHSWLNANADAHVVDGSNSHQNFGAATVLLSATTPTAYTYVRFDASAVDRPVLHAKLSFRNPESNLNSDQREVRLVHDSGWDELGITWNNRPALGPSLGVIPRASRDGTRAIDVTSAVNADPDGVLTFALTTTAAMEPASAVLSREGGAPPMLVLLPGDSAPVKYCAPGTSAAGCQALIGAEGIASASAPAGFLLTAKSVEAGKTGIFFYGTSGRQATPWGNGTSLRCVASPVYRGGLMTPARGGVGACFGSFALDLNARWCPTCPRPNHNPGPGAIVDAQLWYRDPLNTSNQTTSMSDAVEFTVCP